MPEQNESGRPGKGNWIKMLVVAGVALVLVKVFVPAAPAPTDPPKPPEECPASV